MKFTLKKDETKTEEKKVEERRAEVLAKGRKFKYPLQWTKYRVVASTVLIAIIVVALVIVSGWLALYRFGMTDEMLYRVTKIVPAAVANVDGENVMFSDYLMLYRSSTQSIERQSGQTDSEGSVEAQRTQYKRAALDEAEEYTYATKLAKEQGINVTKEEIDNEFTRHLSIGGVERSEEAFLKIVKENFGLDKGEYERMLQLSLTKAKVEAVIDTKANETADKVEDLLLQNGGDFAAVAKQLGAAVQYQETGGMVSNQNIDGGRASEAYKLEPGQQSGKFISMNGDGYYFVKLIKKTEAEVNFVSIKIPFTEFDTQFSALKEENKISEYIEIATDAQ